MIDRPERGVLALTYLALAASGVVLGAIGAFLVPLRLGGSGIEGLAVIIGVAGNVGLGLLGGVGTRTAWGALVPGVGWFLAVGALSSFSPGGDVVIPGSLGGDPGVPKVGTAYLLLGVVSVVVTVLLTSRSTRRARRAVTVDATVVGGPATRP